MNFNCNAPLQWKRSLINCLLMRAFRNSSDFCSFCSEISTLRSIFKRNGYPDQFINGLVSEFLTNHASNEQNFKLNKLKPNTKKPQLVVKEFDEVYLNLPYIGKPSIKLHRKINNQMRKYNLWVKAAFSTTKTGSYFNLKSKCSNLFESNVVYKFTCSRDENVSYIGETRRHLFQRITEHNSSNSSSAVFDHLFNCSDCQNSTNIAKSFTILHRCKRSILYSLESIMICKDQPNLNNKLGFTKGTVPLRIFK